MNKNLYCINLKIPQSFNGYSHRILVLIAAIGFLCIGKTSLAADAFESSPSSNVASCPINHKMYYIGANAPTSTSAQPVVALPLSWTAGNTSKIFTFADNKTFTIAFPILIDKNNSDGTVPFYGSNSGVTSNAINLVHNSTRVQTDHSLDLSVNRPVSKIGYKIQDLDSTSPSGRTPYIEQVDVSANNGQLTFNNIFHNINTPKNIVTAKEGQNCGTGQCTIDAAWGYKSTNSIVTLRHNNAKREISGVHAIGYSDFYFCLAPPKLIVKKELNGNRVNDTDAKRDQFEIKATGGSIAANSFTTAGKAAAVTNNSSVVLELSENTSYKITERVMNATILGDIANYEATYVCNNATTGSTIVTTPITYDATNKTRSFSLSNVAYGDEITCNITNTPINNYTFSGTVFNDNDGMDDSQANKDNADITTSSSPYSNRPNYFNGVFNLPQESGITGSSVSLVNCATPSTIYGSQAVSSTGTFQISAPASIINANANNICLVEERTGTDYPIRTTLATKTIAIQPNTLNYPNNNFGRVVLANAALVLTKYQYINNCNFAAADYKSFNTTNNPRTGFSIQPINDVQANECIAYKIVATNRANLIIDNFIMSDVLQKKGVGNATATAVRVSPTFNATDYATDSVAIGDNGTVKTNVLQLAARNKRDFYFNTKYDPLKQSL